MKWAISFVLVSALAVAAAALAVALRSSTEGRTVKSSQFIAETQVGEPGESPLQRLEQSLDVTGGTLESVAEFGVASGRTLRIHVARTNKGQSCVINEDVGDAVGASCVDGELFDVRAPCSRSTRREDPPGFASCACPV